MSSTLTLLGSDQRGHYLQSPLHDLHALLLFESGRHKDMLVALNCIIDDLGELSVDFARIELFRSLSDEKESVRNAMPWLLQSDIKSFFTLTRAICDHAAEAIGSACGRRRGQIPTSFTKLRTNLDSLRSRLPGCFASLIEDAAWFDGIREARDALVHEGANAVVFPDPEDICFQVYGRRLKRHVWMQGVMVGDGVVRYMPFAAVTFALLVDFLSKVACEIGAYLQLQLVEGASEFRARHYASGFQVVKNWLTEIHFDVTASNE